MAHNMTPEPVEDGQKSEEAETENGTDRSNVTPISPRAARELGCHEVFVHDSVEAACRAALQSADADDAIIACGSIYVAGAARPALRRYAH